MNADIPFVAQERLYCGPAALTMALNGHGVRRRANRKSPTPVYTPGREGTLRTDILSGARRWGRIAVPVVSLPGLLREVAAGNPVIVFQNLALPIAPQWHFAVAIGYDLDRKEIILHSGTHPALRTDLSTFERTWARRRSLGARRHARRTGFRRPPTNTRPWRRRAALERLHQVLPASRAWQAITERWPGSFGGQMGLGNTLLARRDYSAARSAFGRALEIRPEAPEAWNNLALCADRPGRGQGGRGAAAEKAVQLGRGAPTYRDTLDEIPRRRQTSLILGDVLQPDLRVGEQERVEQLLAVRIVQQNHLDAALAQEVDVSGERLLRRPVDRRSGRRRRGERRTGRWSPNTSCRGLRVV